MSAETDMAWAAGLFEGEGCIAYYPPTEKRKYTSRYLRLDMTDEDVVERFREIVGVGSIFYRPPRGGMHHKGLYCWGVAKWPEVKALLHKMLPYLGERRRAAAERVLADPARPYGVAMQRTHCFQGHEYTAESSYIKGKRRICRVCQRAAGRKHAAKKRAQTAA